MTRCRLIFLFPPANTILHLVYVQRQPCCQWLLQMHIMHPYLNFQLSSSSAMSQYLKVIFFAWKNIHMLLIVAWIIFTWSDDWQLEWIGVHSSICLLSMNVKLDLFLSNLQTALNNYHFQAPEICSLQATQLAKVRLHIVSLPAIFITDFSNVHRLDVIIVCKA